MTDHDAQVEDGEPQIVDVTITAPDADWLRQHCAMLVEKRLAASVNIVPAVESIYRWRGRIERTTEAYAIVHTKTECFDEIVRLTNEAHPYETAHVIATVLEQSDQGYRRWILDSTAGR